MNKNTLKKVLSGLAVATLVAAFFVVSPKAAAPKVSAAQVDYFLKLDGVPGEATASGHENEIALNSFAWGDNTPGITGLRDTATGRGVGRATVSDIHFTKMIDKSTPTLMLDASNGRNIKTAVLSLRREGNNSDYAQYTFSNVVVSSYGVSGNNGQEPQDSFSLSFGKVSVQYFQQNSDGAALGGINSCIDIRSNRDCTILLPPPIDTTTPPSDQLQ